MNLGMENETTEHKRSTAELSAAMESVAAILNKHDHGTLYFGVRSRDGKVVGIDVSEKTLRDISQAFTNKIEPRVYPTIEHLVSDDGKSYIKVMFSGTERPYAAEGRYRIRSADEDLPMSRAMLATMMREEHYARAPWDREASDRPLSDVDEVELRKFVERGRARARVAFEYEGVRPTLSSLGLLTGDGRLTNAAAVLFCPSVDIQLKMGMFVDHRRIDVLDMRQEAGTLFFLVDAAEAYITANTRRRFVFDGSRTREEVPEIPREVVREALLNAFCHREWHHSGYVQVDIYNDAVDVISPGWFIKGQDPEEHLDGRSTSSDTRNRLIASMLFRSGDIESSGLGMRKIRYLCDEAGVGISYKRISFGTKLTLTRPEPYAPDQRTSSELDFEEVPKKFRRGSEVGLSGLSDSERAAYAFLQKNGPSRTSDVAATIDLTSRATLKVLRRLVSEGIAEVSGSTSARRYRLK